MSTLGEVRTALRNARCWLPLLAGFACVFAAWFVGDILVWLLLLFAFGFLLDGVTAWWERAGGTGNLTTYRQ
jgi:hypothetical protein